VDWIVGATMVIANGSAVEVSATQNPDLFWAIRGAGSSFGIISSYKFNTFAAPSQTVVFQANLNWGSGDSCTSGWQAIQTYMTSGQMPAEMNFRVFAMGTYAQLQGLYHGTTSQLNTAIAPLLKSLGTSLSKAQQTDWVGGFNGYTNGDRVDVTHPYGMTETFYSKGLATSELPRSNVGTLLRLRGHSATPVLTSLISRCNLFATT
jgi:hypothetical protein